MALLWPGFLMLLAGIPLLAAIYLWSQRRRRRAALRYSSLALIRPALPKKTSWRRYIPPALFLLAIASLIVAMARPAAIIKTPEKYSTVILAIDVSYSMALDDIRPTRLGAAQAAALNFIHSQKAKTRIGLVVFSGSAQLVVPPTTDQQALETAVRGLTTGPRTAIGEGILTSLQAIAAEDLPRNDTQKTGASAPGARPAGDFAPAIVVLLTDGRNTCCHKPIDAAQTAAERGVRIYTIGFGTRMTASSRNFKGQPMLIPETGGSGYSNDDIDEVTLKRIASMTDGEFYSASSASDLEKIFSNLPTALDTQPRTEDISFIFIAAGAGLVAAAMVLSMLWHPLP